MSTDAMQWVNDCSVEDQKKMIIDPPTTAPIELDSPAN